MKKALKIIIPVIAVLAAAAVIAAVVITQLKTKQEQESLEQNMECYISSYRLADEETEQELRDQYHSAVVSYDDSYQYDSGLTYDFNEYDLYQFVVTTVNNTDYTLTGDIRSMAAADEYIVLPQEEQSNTDSHYSGDVVFYVLLPKDQNALQIRKFFLSHGFTVYFEWIDSDSEKTVHTLEKTIYLS